MLGSCVGEDTSVNLYELEVHAAPTCTSLSLKVCVCVGVGGGGASH